MLWNKDPAKNNHFQDEVNLHYFEKAHVIAGGLVDRLNGYSVWKEHSAPEIVAIAREIELIQ